MAVRHLLPATCHLLPDASILLDVLWHHYLEDIARENGISTQQRHSIVAGLGEAFQESFTGEGDPRHILITLLKRRVSYVKFMEPHANVSEPLAPMDPDEYQVLLSLFGDSHAHHHSLNGRSLPPGRPP